MEFNTTNIATASLSVIVSLLLVAYFSKYYLLFRGVLDMQMGNIIPWLYPNTGDKVLETLKDNNAYLFLIPFTFFQICFKRSFI